MTSTMLHLGSCGSAALQPAPQVLQRDFMAYNKTRNIWGSFSAGHLPCTPRPKAHCTTYIAELQGQALRGLELSSTQVQICGGSFQLLRDSQHLLGYVHLRRQTEMERAARILREAHGHWLVAGHFLGALTRFEQSLISVLTDVWEDAVKGNPHSRQATDTYLDA